MPGGDCMRIEKWRIRAKIVKDAVMHILIIIIIISQVFVLYARKICSFVCRLDLRTFCLQIFATPKIVCFVRRQMAVCLWKHRLERQHQFGVHLNWRWRSSRFSHKHLAFKPNIKKQNNHQFRLQSFVSVFICESIRSHTFIVSEMWRDDCRSFRLVANNIAIF